MWARRRLVERFDAVLIPRTELQRTTAVLRGADRGRRSIGARSPTDQRRLPAQNWPLDLRRSVTASRPDFAMFGDPVVTEGKFRAAKSRLSRGAARGIRHPGPANPITTGFSPVLPARLWTLSFGPCGRQDLVAAPGWSGQGAEGDRRKSCRPSTPPTPHGRARAYRQAPKTHRWVSRRL
jgi:hypothetical protein